jgi:hypothetical protein
MKTSEARRAKESKIEEFLVSALVWSAIAIPAALVTGAALFKALTQRDYQSTPKNYQEQKGDVYSVIN